MTMGNPATPIPQASEGQAGSSILALLDAIPAPRALWALLDAGSVQTGRGRPGIETATGQAFSASSSASRIPQDHTADTHHDAAVCAYLGLLGNLNQNRRPEAFWIRAWRRGVASAYVSAFLHGKGGHTEPLNLAFAVGLLHDIGSPALASVVPKSYQRVIEDSERTGKPLCEVERALLGTDHTAAGAHLLLRWGACREIRDCARFHHLPWHTLALAGEETALSRLVNVADAIVGIADGAGLSWEDESRWLAGGGLPGLSAEILNEAAELARARLSELTPSGGLVGGASVPADDVDPFGRPVEHVGSRAGAAEDPEVAQERADWEQATRRLLKSAPEFWFTTDICRAAAGHLVQAIGLTSCAVVVDDLARGVRSVGFAATGRTGGAFRCCLDQACRVLGQAPLESHGAPREAAEVARVASARDEHMGIWQRCDLGEPVEPLWIRPWVHTDRLRVVAIFEADPKQIAACELRIAPDGAYATVLEALVKLVARQEAEQQRMDTVLDATRSGGLDAHREIWSRSVSMISEVAAGAAHEINNPLAVISGRAQMELARADDPQLSKSLQSIVAQAERTSGIIMELVEFAKPAKPDPSLCRLDDHLVRALQGWQARSGLAAHQVLVGFLDPALTVLVDPDQFLQIMHALLENALSAMDSKSALLQINSPSRPSDEQIRIVIEDNGAGMDARVLAHAIAPFFSNRTAGRSRGLGLSRACRLADANGGTLWLESLPNVGTRAIVALPAR